MMVNYNYFSSPNFDVETVMGTLIVQQYDNL